MCIWGSRLCRASDCPCLWLSLLEQSEFYWSAFSFPSASSAHCLLVCQENGDFNERNLAKSIKTCFPLTRTKWAFKMCFLLPGAESFETVDNVVQRGSEVGVKLVAASSALILRSQTHGPIGMVVPGCKFLLCTYVSIILFVLACSVYL